MSKPGRLRQLLDSLFTVTLIGIVIYLIVDGVKETPKAEPVEVDPIVDRVRVCTNATTENEPNKWFEPTALDEYVWKRDGTYRYEVKKTQWMPQSKVTRIVVKFWSQTWLLNEDWFLNQSGGKEWWHWMTIHVPADTARDFEPELLDSAIMIVAGGGNNDKDFQGDSADANLALGFSRGMGVVSVLLNQVPNGHCTFAEDVMRNQSSAYRSGDSLIAYGWRRYIEQNGDDPERLVLMPMVKAAFLAMNVTDDILHDPNVQCGGPGSKTVCRPGAITMNRWALTGGSKRGWTTWLTAAVDRGHRIKLILPAVLSLHNMKKNFHHHWRAYGGWSFVMKDYYGEDIFAHLDDPAFDKARTIHDPYMFKERLTMPKIIISSAGDEFFLPDDSHYWLSEMPGPVYFRLLPNAEHTTLLSGRSTKHWSFGLRHAFLNVMKHRPMPEYCTERFTRQSGRKGVKVMSNEWIRRVETWIGQNKNKKRRDFRLAHLSEDGNTVLGNVSHSAFDDDDFIHFEQTGEPVFNAALWRSSGFQTTPRTPSGEFLYEYEAELGPSEDKFNAFFLNVQFTGYDNRGWFEFTSEIQFADVNIDPFPECHGVECRGEMV